MKITFDQYIKNPSGHSRGIIVSQRELARQVYTDKYNKMMIRANGAINYELYRSQDQSNYYIFFQMPSEGTKDLFYDTVIEFYTKDAPQKQINKLDGYFVKFFSNDPNFNFTYAYVFNKDGLIIDKLKSKLNEKALTERPKVTNPNREVGYVKALYFAYLFMKDRGLFRKISWMNAITSESLLNRKFQSIMNSDRKLDQVRALKELNNNSKTKKSYTDSNNVEGLSVQAKGSKLVRKHTNIVSKIDRENARRGHYVRRIKKIK